MVRADWEDVPIALGEMEPVRDENGEISDFRWIAANPATHRKFLQPEGSLIGKTIHDVFPQICEQPIFQYMIDTFKAQKRGRFVLALGGTDGQPDLRFITRFHPRGETLLTSLEDVSDVMRERDDALNQRQMFETACSHAVHGLILSDRHGNVHYANQAIADMLGYELDAFQALSSKDVVHPSDLSRNWDMLDKLISGEVSQDVRDKRYIRADGAILHVSVSLSVVDDFLDGEPLFINHIRDITEQRARNQQLHMAVMQAEEAGRLKSQFLANMSHEIRTPLNGIIGMAQILEHSDLTEDQADNLAVLKESGNTLLALLNDILDLSKIEAGRLEVSPTKADLRHKLSRVFKIHRLSAEEKGLSLRTVVHPSVPARLIFDPVRIRQCLDNLISNAIKFTDSGEITVVVTSDENVNGQHRITVHVQDTGCGIPSEKQAAIFEAFQQLDGSIARSHGGTGLGLAITRQLAYLMGGGLSVVSEVGKGSVFSLTFKAGAVDAPNLSASQIPVTAAPVTPATGLSKKQVLIVDDNSINRRVARTMLGNYGITCLEAADGAEALEQMQSTPFDVILLDIHMPVMDGVKTYAQMQQLPDPIGSLPVIALTADAMSGDRERYLDLGMDGYVSKPIDERMLISEITRVLDAKDAALSMAG